MIRGPAKNKFPRGMRPASVRERAEFHRQEFLDIEGFLNRLKLASEVSITVTGRKTKRKFTTPVWFAGQRESNTRSDEGL